MTDQTVHTKELQPTSQQPQAVGALANTDSQRVIAEVQAAMIIAKTNPRDTLLAQERIKNACTRPGLAGAALYTYARGGTNISGPSIRLAETMAQAWGNLHYGIREIEQQQGKSVMQAYCWDLETGTRRETAFHIPHIRHTKKGDYNLTDPRDIYEMAANMGARRLRACILAIIPGDVTEMAVAQCEDTLNASADTSEKAMKAMLKKFGEFGVTKEMIEKRIQRKLESIQPAQVVNLRKIYSSLKDGMSGAGEWFEIESSEERKTGTDAARAAVGIKPDPKPTKTKKAPEKAEQTEKKEPLASTDNPEEVKKLQAEATVLVKKLYPKNADEFLWSFSGSQWDRMEDCVTIAELNDMIVVLEKELAEKG